MSAVRRAQITTAAIAAGALILIAIALPRLADADRPPIEGTALPAPDDREPPRPVLPAPPATTTAPTTPGARQPGEPAPVWGQDPTPPSDRWRRPDLLEVYRDPAYGSTMRRLTSAEDTRFDRNTYSRRQAENADGNLFLTYHGDAEYRVYRRSDASLVRALEIGPGAEPQWHPTDPDLIRHIAGDNASIGDLRYYETDVTTGERRTIADLTARVQARFPAARYLQDRDEGSPSADGSRSAWILYDGAEEPIGLVHHDLAEDRILGMAPLDTGSGPLDWVSTSPSGRFVMAGHWEATLVYDADLTGRRVVYQGADHSDIALDENGRDTYIYQDFSAGPDGGWLMAVDLASLARTRLFDLYGTEATTSIHISGKGYDRPGWVVVSTYSCKVPDGAWSCTKVMAVELGGGHRILNLAHTYNCGQDYWTETHAVVNRDFTRVYFNSDGGSCGIDAEVYEITIPDFS